MKQIQLAVRWEIKRLDTEMDVRLVLSVSVTVLNTVSLILLIASLSGNAWVKFTFKLHGVNTTLDVHTTQGLWKRCTDIMILTGEAKEACSKLPKTEVSDWVRAVRAFMLLSVLTSLASTFSSCATIFKKLPGLVSFAFALSSALLCWIALGVYAGESEHGPRVKYAWCFVIGWVGFGISLLSSLLLFALLRLKGTSVTQRLREHEFEAQARDS